MPDLIYPRPQWLRPGDVTLEADCLLGIGIADEAHREIARRLAADLLTRHRLEATIVDVAQASLRLGTLDELAVAEELRRRGIAVDAGVRQPGGYILSVRPAGLLLAGFDAAGIFYGVQSLLQLVMGDDARVTLPAVEVQDWPHKAIRGIHIYMPGREQIPFFKRLLGWLASLKYNTVFLEVSGGMQYERRPEINQAWEQFCATASAFPGGAWGLQASQPYMKNSTHTELGGGSYLLKTEVAELLAYARSLHIEVIPEVQSLSHSYYLCLAYPELAERADDPYPDTYCPSNPKSYEVLFDVLEEVLEVFEPRVLHIGHDEIYHLGICPRCQGKSGADLLAFDVNRTHAFLARRGVRTAMWGEKLMPVYSAGRPEGGLERDATHDSGHGSNPLAAAQEPASDRPRHTMLPTYEAVDQIPRDVLISDWFWMLDPYSIRFFEKHGFEVVFGNFGDNFGAQIFDRWNERGASQAVLGAEVSTWCEVSEFALGYNGCLFNMLFAAQMLWWSNYRDVFRSAVTTSVASRMPETRRYLADSSPALGPASFQPLELPAAAVEPAPFAVDLRPAETAPFTLLDGGALRVDAAQRAQVIPVGRQCAELQLLHTCASDHTRLPTWYLADPLRFPVADQIASYHVRYADGARVSIPIFYGSQIAAWDIPYGEHIDALPYWADPLPVGTDPAGRCVTLYRFVWENPRPGAVVEQLELELNGQDSATVWLFAAAIA